MDIVGLWRIAELNAMDMSFNQTWKKVEGLDSDPDVPMMQKMMAKTTFVFKEDGTFLQLAPKEMAGGEGEPYDDDHVIGHKSEWKEEGGKLLIASEENGEYEWSEVVPAGDGFEIFGFFRIVKA